MLKFLVKQQKIEILEHEVIADSQISFVNLKFVFDGDWKKFHKVVQFTQCDDTYNRVLGTDGISCFLPSELHSGAVKMSVFGYDTENTSGLRATTVPVILHIRPSGFIGDGTEEVPPTPDLYAQLLRKIDEKAETIQNGADGKNGLSAYEIAQNNGFKGTSEEWLLSLKGEKGDAGPQGIQGEQGLKGDKGATGSKGAKGDTGADGKSAYEIWLEIGNTGTETDFFNSLKGDAGERGLQGEKGDRGLTGAKGSKGDVGADGKSAYEIWLEQGNIGEKLDFLLSLKGEKGDTGTSGKNGRDGLNGKSAYEIWLEIGNTGTETEFLKSLKGDKGDTGNASTETAELSERLNALTDATINISVTDSLARKIEVIRGEMNGLQSHNTEMESELREEIVVLKETDTANTERLNNLETELGDIKTVLATIVEVTE